MKRRYLPNHLLRDAREARGWSQAALAGLLETNVFTISRWERGYALPGIYYRKHLCDLFALTTAALGLTTAIVPECTPDPLRFLPPRYAMPTHALIGRQPLLDALAQRLIPAGIARSFAFYGLPGVGKTSLVASLIQLPGVQELFPDGVLWAGVGKAADIFTLLSNWALQLGLDAAEIDANSTIAALTETVQRRLAQKRFLIIIDDVWETEQAFALKVGGSACAHLLTTRFLPIAAHFAHQNAVLVHALDQASALHLLRSLAPTLPEYAPQLQLLAEQVGYLPLALTLMGHFLHRESIGQQPRRIEAALAHLQDPRARLTLGEPHAAAELPPHVGSDAPFSLEAVIATSVTHLPPGAREVLHAVSAFPPQPASFSEDALLALCEANPNLAYALQCLIDSGLLESAGTARYTLHQSVAEYARLQGNPPTRLMVAYYRDYLSAHQSNLTLLDIERNNLNAAIGVALEEGWTELATDMAVKMARYWWTRGLYALAERYFSRLVDLTNQPAEKHLLLQSMEELLWIYFNQGAYDKAENLFERAWELAQRTGSEDRHSSLLYLRGLLYIHRGEYVQAVAMLQASKNYAHKLDQMEHESKALFGLANCCYYQGKYEEAETIYKAIRDASHARKDYDGYCVALQNLGAIAGNKGRYRAAYGYFSQALTIGHSNAISRLRISSLLTSLGETDTVLGKFAEARQHYLEALTIAREIAHQERVCGVLAKLAEAAVRLHAFSEADTYAEQALAMALAMEHKQHICEIHMIRTEIFLQREQWDEAETAVHAGLQIARHMNYRWQASNGLALWGFILLQRQQIEASREALEQAIEIAQAVHSHELEALAIWHLAQVYALKGNQALARATARKSFAIFQELDHWRAAEVHTWLASVPVFAAPRNDGADQIPSLPPFVTFSAIERSE